MRHTGWLSMILGAIAILLSACLTEPFPRGGLTLKVTDAPVDDAKSVVIEFTGVQLKPEGGLLIDIRFDAPRAIDLLQFRQGDAAVLLDDERLPAGDYDWLELKLATATDLSASYIQFETGAFHPLPVPIDAQPDLRIGRDFTIAENDLSTFTIDFDLRRSIVPAGAGFQLRPTLRMVNDDEAGSIGGTVASGLLGRCDSDADGDIYIYRGSLELNELGDLGSDREPVNSVPVRFDREASEFRYRSSPMHTGPYTVAFTCEAGQDAPGRVDDIDFLSRKEVQVVAGTVTLVDFFDRRADQ